MEQAIIGAGQQFVEASIGNVEAGKLVFAAETNDRSAGDLHRALARLGWTGNVNTE